MNDVVAVSGHLVCPGWGTRHARKDKLTRVSHCTAPEAVKEEMAKEGERMEKGWKDGWMDEYFEGQIQEEALQVVGSYHIKSTHEAVGSRQAFASGARPPSSW